MGAMWTLYPATNDAEKPAKDLEGGKNLDKSQCSRIFRNSNVIVTFVLFSVDLRLFPKILEGFKLFWAKLAKLLWLSAIEAKFSTTDKSITVGHGTGTKDISTGGGKRKPPAEGGGDVERKITVGQGKRGEELVSGEGELESPAEGGGEISPPTEGGGEFTMVPKEGDYSEYFKKQDPRDFPEPEPHAGTGSVHEPQEPAPTYAIDPNKPLHHGKPL